MSTTHSTGGISVRGLSKAYDDTLVLDDLTFELAPGKIYGLLGANGAGKTTLMSLICTHTFATKGSITIDGRDPRENAEILARLCFIRENQVYNDAFRVSHVLAVMPAFYPHWDADLATRLLDRFHLPMRTKSNKLSRGQRSALAIVLALASRAPYTFLDEPYLGLDPTARSIFYEELLRDYAEHPRTVVMSTHLVDEAADLMEEVLVLHNGHIALRADIDQARREAFVARGLAEQVAAVIGDRPVLSQRSLGRILSATVHGTLSAAEEARAADAHVSIEPVSLQELVAAIGLGDASSLLAESAGSASSSSSPARLEGVRR